MLEPSTAGPYPDHPGSVPARDLDRADEPSATAASILAGPDGRLGRFPEDRPADGPPDEPRSIPIRSHPSPSTDRAGHGRSGTAVDAISPSASPTWIGHRTSGLQDRVDRRPQSASATPSALSPRPPIGSQHHPHPVRAGDPPPTPLPHFPQAHFYSAPHLSSRASPRPGKGAIKDDGRCFYAFDHLAGGDGSDEVDNVLLVGGHGTLDVFRVDRERLVAIGHWRRLRGRVVGARILPRPARQDDWHDHRPLVVLTLHGPSTVSPPRDADPASPDPVTEPIIRTPTSHRRNLAHAAAAAAAAEDDEDDPSPDSYTTTVEVFSLPTGHRLATLFASLPVILYHHHPISAPHPPPPPVGNLSVDANPTHVVVASGTSGELWIFGRNDEARHRPDEEPRPFKFLAKVWTAVQPYGSGPLPAILPSEYGSAGGGTAAGLLDPPTARAVFSLGQRWLAYAPAKPPSHPSLGGRPLLVEDLRSKPAGGGGGGGGGGVSAHAPPPQPQITCAVDRPDGDGFFNRVAREVTQEFIRGARWVGDRGLQVLRDYWNRPARSSEPASGFAVVVDRKQEEEPSSFDPAHPAPSPFPPTHAHVNHRSQPGGEPSLVSILDLARLDHGQDLTCTAPRLLHPIATFQPPLGCSFLSLAPGGLHLLTASGNGDVQFVWNLMKMIPDKPTSTVAASASTVAGPATSVRPGPHVRQMAHFSRMTAANIVDVVWTSPIGDRLAIVTEKGTVHMFDIPASAFQWPPPRRVPPGRVGPDPPTSGPSNALYQATGAAAASHTVSAAVKMVNTTAQPLLAVARGRRSSGGGGAGPGPVGGGSVGSPPTSRGSPSGKIVVTHGLSKSLGAATETINVLRSIGENRIHLPPSRAVPTPGTARWLTGKEAGLIGIVGDGKVRIHEVRTKAAPKPNKRQSLSRGQLIEHDVPVLADLELPPPITSPTPDEGRHGPRANLTGFWNVRSRPGRPRGRTTYDRVHPLSHAEIETNSPYQPFHTDRRVSLLTYDRSGSRSTRRGDDLSGPNFDRWVFGQEIPATRLDLAGISADVLDGDDRSDHVLGPMENVLRRPSDSDETRQLLITTRRRRRAKDGVGDDGFFEDDCEVLDFASDRV